LQKNCWMKFNVITIPPFDKQLKRLAKKYPSLKDEFANLVHLLKVEPRQGVSLSNDCYKIRIAIKSKGKGKAGGARVVTHLQVSEKSVFLLAIYDKSEQEIITDKEVKYLLSFIQ
jgi:mRNA-degrading endonuclease RelE of RelBE toxin-antitoxin system